ncbi:MAG TPA: hypothetical protein VMM36_11530 [Opitutaceae bacterium]|nr:hypothetical protein [Opitutaceae bacterium]
MAAAYGIGYFVLHHKLEPCYRAEIMRSANLSFSAYGIERLADGSRFGMLENGQLFSPGGDRLPAPFALETFSAFQGALWKYHRLAEALNDLNATRRAAVLAGMRRDTSGSVEEIPASVFNYSKPDESLVLRLDQATAQQFRQLKGESFRCETAALLKRVTIWRPYAAGSVDLSGSSAAPTDPRIAAVRNLVANHGKKIADDHLTGAPEQGFREGLTAAIDSYYEVWRRDLEQTAVGFLADPAGTTPEKADGESWEGDTRPAPPTSTGGDWLARVNSHVRADLVAITHSELGSFWLIGRYRWMEIVMWVWFGVFIKGLIDLGLVVAGLKSRHYEPREFLRLLGKFVYAPVLALGLFFLSTFIGAGREAFELGRSSPAVLGFALTLGIFPNTAFRIIQDLATRLFRDELTSSEKEGKPLPARTRVDTPDFSRRPPGSLITVDQLKASVTAHITGPLKHEL